MSKLVFKTSLPTHKASLHGAMQGQGSGEGCVPREKPKLEAGPIDPGTCPPACLLLRGPQRGTFSNKQVFCGLTGVLGLCSHIQLGSLSSYYRPITLISPPLSTKYMSLIHKTARGLQKTSLELSTLAADHTETRQPPAGETD